MSSFLIGQVRDLAHVRQPYIFGVHIVAGEFQLFPDRGRESAVQLSADALGAQRAEGAEGGDALEKILVGTEGGGVFFYIGRDHFDYPGGFFLKETALKITGNELVKKSVILRKIPVILHQAVEERAFVHDLPGGGGVDGGVDIQLRVIDRLRHSERVGGKGQVVIPGKDLQLPILLVEEVIVSRAPQIAVQIDDKHLNGKITERFLHADSAFQISTISVQSFERFDKARLVLLVGLEFGIAEDVVVISRVVRNILESHVFIFCVQGSVVRLVELAVTGTEIPPGKCLLRLLHGEEKAVGISVYRDPHVAAQRRRDAHVLHHVIGDVVFQIAVVLEGGIQRKFVQTVVGLSFLKMVEFQFQAVALQPVLRHQTSGIISLCPKSGVGKGLPVYDRIAPEIGFGGRCGEKGFPVLQLQVDRMYPAVVKKTRFIAGGGMQRLYAEGLSLCEQDSYDKG